MSYIQITNEISERLTSLRVTTTAAIDFNRAEHFTVEGNRQFVSLERYQQIIQAVGRLMARYQAILEADIRSCEQVITNVRETDQQMAQSMAKLDP